MKRILLSAILLCFTSSFAKAQSGNKVSLSLGPEFNFPFNTIQTYYGKTRQYYKDGVGGALKVELPVLTTLHVTVSAGYMHYTANNYYLMYIQTAPYPDYAFSATAPKQPPYLFLPVKAGLQYYYSKYLYFSAEAGEAIKLNFAAKNSFMYSGGLGGVIPFNGKSGLDLGLRYERGYEIWSYPFTISQLAVRVAYKYRF